MRDEEVVLSVLVDPQDAARAITFFGAVGENQDFTDMQAVDMGN